MNVATIMRDLRTVTGRNYGQSVKRGKFRLVEWIERDGDPFAEQRVVTDWQTKTHHADSMIDIIINGEEK